MQLGKHLARAIDMFGSASAAILFAGLLAFLLVDLLVTFWFG